MRKISLTFPPNPVTGTDLTPPIRDIFRDVRTLRSVIANLVALVSSFRIVTPTAVAKRPSTKVHGSFRRIDHLLFLSNSVSCAPRMSFQCPCVSAGYTFSLLADGRFYDNCCVLPGGSFLIEHRHPREHAIRFRCNHDRDQTCSRRQSCHAI